MRKYFFKLIKKKRVGKIKTIKEILDYKEYRKVSEEILKNRVAQLAHEHGFLYNRVVIKDTRTRWGSCSSKKNINLHYKLIFLDDTLRDYVIVHELCHLREMNHSKFFWKEVENIIPDYRNSMLLMKKLHPEKVVPSKS